MALRILEFGERMQDNRIRKRGQKKRILFFPHACDMISASNAQGLLAWRWKAKKKGDVPMDANPSLVAYLAFLAVLVVLASKDTDATTTVVKMLVEAIKKALGRP